MPELPEIRALAERLGAVLVGRTLTDVQVPSFSGLKTVTPQPDALLGATLVGCSSRGKFLCVEFGERGRALLHLGNAGRVAIENPAKSTRPRGALARFDFEGSGLLVREHGTERRAGLWVLAPTDDGPLADLGPEPAEPEFAAFLRHSDDRRHLHGMLRDQHTVAGIGRGYADDILQRAGLSPFAALGSLDGQRRERLLSSVLEVLDEALAKERTRTGALSAASLGDRFVIHRHAGAPCPTCGRTLERVSYSSHEITYCPDCQTAGRVLADRRLSRLLK